jgi:hypothetical protein
VNLEHVLRDTPRATEIAAEIATFERMWAVEVRAERGDPVARLFLEALTSTGWDEAWLWPGAGYATFEFADAWILQRVWIRPEHRRHGLLTAAWRGWLDRYGVFQISGPNPAARAFLAKVGHPARQPAAAA